MNLKGKKVLLRVDFNVPLKGNKVADDFRIKAPLPGIKDLLKKGAKVLLLAHLESDDKNPSLEAVSRHLEKLLGMKVRFIKGKIPANPCDFPERVWLFDNLRLNSCEKNNDRNFAKQLARWGDYYINDAFSASHREHASIVGLPKFLPHEAGPLMKAEIKNLSNFFSPEHPFLFILAGKKFATKEPLISKFLKKADAIFIGGALANTFLAKRGTDVKRSKVESVKISDKILWSQKIILPEDWEIEEGSIYDAGPRTMKALSELAQNAKLVLWNGTIGLCEKGFTYGTKELGKSLGRSKAFRLVGGGDTVAAIRKMKLEKNFDFISTGGGAMLEFLAKETLPGIAALGEPRLQSRREALKKK